MTASRLLLDVSSLVRWLGPPTGMIRVEAELASAAQDRSGITPVVFDKEVGHYRRLQPAWATAARPARNAHLAKWSTATPDLGLLRVLMDLAPNQVSRVRVASNRLVASLRVSPGTARNASRQDGPAWGVRFSELYRACGLNELN